MDALTAGRTSFVIAHRLSTIRNADRILAISEGDIVESGTQDELLNAKGVYADLYNRQRSGSEGSGRAQDIGDSGLRKQSPTPRRRPNLGLQTLRSRHD